MKINKLLLLILIFLIAVTASSCNESVKLTEPIEIHIQVPFDIWAPSINTDVPTSALGKIYQDAASNFHELNPQIKVIVDYNTEFMYSMISLTSLLESDKSPDIVPIRTDRVLGAEELLWDLLQLQKSSESREIDIDQQILDSTMVDGKLLTLPYSAYPQVMLYNKEIFDAAHISYPQNDWTWEQFREISKKFERTNSPVIDLGSSMLELLMAGKGESLLSPDGDTAIGYLDSPEAIRMVQWRNAYFRDVLVTNSTFIENSAVYARFISNSSAMLISSYGNEFSNFQGSNKTKLGVAPMPHFEGGKRASLVYYDGFGISQKSKHPEAAWKFIDYLTLTKNEDSVKFAEHILTTSRSLAEATGQSKDPIKSIYMDETNYAVKPSLEDYNLQLSFSVGDPLDPFYDLVFTADEDIPAKLHKYALGLDQEMKRLKLAEDQQAESSSP
jgi:multiple sugar transport system substrate-binding protein